MKYFIEVKPIRKYKPLFTADSLQEISDWLDSNAKWTRLIADQNFEKRVDQQYGDLVVTTLALRGDMMDDNDNVPLARTEVREAYHLCHRQTPSRK